MSSHAHAIIEPEIPAQLLNAGDSIFPASFAQQRLLFLQQLNPESAAYNMALPMWLTGDLNPMSLAKALNEIIRRHEPLRTTFKIVGGNAMQVIAPFVSLKLPLVDLSRLPEETREDEAMQLIKQDAKKPFDLTCDLVVRAQLFRLSPTEHIFAPNIHHVASDGWSTAIFFNELAVLYEDFCNERPSSLPEFSIQYADFAVWQRQWLQGEMLEKQLAYWKTQLANVPELLEFPKDRPRPAIQSHRGARIAFSLDKSLTDALRTLSQQKGCSVFMTLLAAFKTLAMRCSGQKDIVIGSPIGVRENGEIEGLIGCFVNTLVLRTDLSGNPTFHELLGRVQSVVLDAFDNQQVPLERLVGELKLPRHPDRNPLFQILFQFFAGTGITQEFGGLTMTRLWPVENNTAKFDLALTLEESGDGMVGDLEYSTDLFDRSTVTRMLGHFKILLEGIVKNPDQRIGTLPLMESVERQQFLSERNDRDVSFSANISISELFEKQVQATPYSVAVICDEQRLTYRELNERSNQLAHYLMKLGVGAEVPVALCLDRSLEMIVGILAVIKAGGAYVPIDLAYPKERLAFMLTDTKAPVLLTQQNLLASLPEHSAKVICIDSDSEKFSGESNENPTAKITGENVAYIIFTSGSTGEPKGVLVTHHNVVRLFKQTEPWYQFNSSDVWTLFHSYAFDFSVWEIWGALLYGGRLVVVPYLVSRSPGAFYELLAREKVTVLNQTPSAFRQLIWTENSAESKQKLSLRYIIFGGEALELQSLQPWFDLHGDEKPLLVNMYGITETTVHVTYRPIKRSDLASNVGSVIGIPIPDLQLHVLDENLQPVVPCVPGEMFVGGAGVARGYLNRPELTAERFISDPFSKTPGAKLYRSGDLAQFHPNGELEYLGRIDHQVKIRGFRIELGEIETALNRHPAIRESVVIADENGEGDKRLVSYVVANEEIPVSDLRSFLARTIPDYMIPSVFMFLESLPLTPNGKVDLKALSAHGTARPMTNELFVAPRNLSEEALAKIWCDVLRVEQVGVHDNFFELGGHSLLATQVVSRMRSVNNKEIPLRDFFSAPTVAGLSAIMENESPKETPLTTIARLPRQN